MATIDKRGALHDRTGKYSGSVRGGVTTEVKPRTAIEWKQALFSDFSPPETSPAKNPEATSAAKQAIFLAPIPTNSSEGNTVKLKNVLKGIGVGAAVVAVAAGCAGGNASSAEPAKTSAAPTTASAEATPDAEATETPAEATAAPEAPSGPAPGEVGYVISAADVEAGAITVTVKTVKETGYSYDVFTTPDGQPLYMASDGSAIIIDNDQPLPQAVLDDLAGFSQRLDGSSGKYSKALRSLPNAGFQGMLINQFRTMDSEGSIHTQVTPLVISNVSDADHEKYEPIGKCIADATYKTARDGSTESIILDHDEAIALAQKCAKLKPGIPIYDVTGLVPPTQLQ
jgi:hypothetical protein